MTKRIFALVICGCLLINTWAAAADTPTQDAASGKSHAIAPNFMAATFHGDAMSLYEKLDQSQTVVLVFWSTWCRYCKKLLPEIVKLREAVSEEQVAFFALNVWEDSDPVAYMEKYKIDLPLVLRADTIASQYHIKTTPGVVVIGEDHRILYQRSMGDSTKKVLTQLKALLLPAP